MCIVLVEIIIFYSTIYSHLHQYQVINKSTRGNNYKPTAARQASDIASETRKKNLYGPLAALHDPEIRAARARMDFRPVRQVPFI